MSEKFREIVKYIFIFIMFILPATALTYRGIRGEYSLINTYVPNTGDDGYKELHIGLIALFGIIILIVLGRIKKRK